MEYSFLNLSSYEFEQFCSDFLRKKLKIDFKTFKEGKDLGIDCLNSENNIVCQCKRYSDYNNLKAVCLQEKEKVEKLNCKEYYLMTTVNLTVLQTNELYEIFKDYMPNAEHIISLNDIEDFIGRRENVDILEKHYKLWLSSSNVLSSFMNKYANQLSKYKLDEIKREAEYFVETKAYKEAIKLIKTKNIVLITGEPGIGKTITSDMVAGSIILRNKDYILRYGQCNDIKQIIETTKLNNDKEVIYIDDFLGQTMAEIDRSKIEELKVLLYGVRKFKNKKIILNCRITILNKAMREQIEFKKLFTDLGIYEYLIDTSKITDLNKANIIFNTIKRYKVPKEMYNSIIENKNYYKIINHVSYNSRIIEYCALNYEKVKNNNLFSYVIENLDNPANVWHDEFTRIGKYASLVMYELYTLGNKYIPISALKESVNMFLLNNPLSVNNDDFEITISYLAKSMVAYTVFEEETFVSVINPSVNDYIQNYLTSNDFTLKTIYNSAIYLQQIEKIEKIVEDKNGLQRKSILDYKIYRNYDSVHINKDDMYLSYISNNEVLDENLEKFLIDQLLIKNKSKKMIDIFLNEKMNAFYCLDDYTTNIDKMCELFSDADYTSILKLFELFYCKEGIDRQEIIRSFRENIKTSVFNYIFNYSIQYLFDKICYADIYKKFECIGEEYSINHDYSKELFTEVCIEISDKYIEIKEEFLKIGYDISDIDVYIYDAIDECDIDDMLEEDLNDFINNNEEYENIINDYEIEMVFKQEY